MKKVLCIAMILMMLTGVFAETAVATLISVSPFEVSQEGDVFTIILDGNVTTGYEWTYVVNKTDHVEFISDEYITNSELIGAPGKHHFTFKVLSEGVSTIDFSHARSFEENSSINNLDILVYKSGDKVFVEENGIVTIQNDAVSNGPVSNGPVSNGPIPTLYIDPIAELYNKSAAEEINGVTMIPVAETLRALGYEVQWIEETQSIEISKGAQWTSITIGKNAYFKNRMAPSPLSAAPVIVNNRTMVPAEFFNVILSLGIQIEGGELTLNEYEMGVYTGYIKDIKVNDKGTTSLFVTFEADSEMTDIVIHTTSETTFVQGSVRKGDLVNVLTSMATTMSLPPQTSGYVIY